MKALSVRQPWAWLLINGMKDVENRSWETNYRGPLLIHAAKRIEWDVFELLENKFGVRVWDKGLAGVPGDTRAWWKGQTGGLIGIVHLGEITTGPYNLPELDPWALPGCFHWRVHPVQAFKEPISCRGRRGLFDIPEGIMEKNALEALDYYSSQLAMAEYQNSILRTVAKEAAKWARVAPYCGGSGNTCPAEVGYDCPRMADQGSFCPIAREVFTIEHCWQAVWGDETVFGFEEKRSGREA